MSLSPSARSPWTLALALLLAACASQPAAIPAPPTPPDNRPLEPAPSPPPLPYPPQALKHELPPAPEGRLQDVDEVFPTAFRDNATPARFPVDTSNVVVAVLPSGTAPARRLAVLAAFLAAGYRVKDAGEFKDSSFLVDHHPWWTHLGTGFQRKIEDGETAPPTALRSDDRTTGTKERTYTGFDGMRLSLDDPTSLWAPDLLANPNLHSDYFVRVFDLHFDEGTVPVDLANVYDPAAVQSFRDAADKVNKDIAAFNHRAQTYAEECKTYERQYTEYRDKYALWEQREAARYAERCDAYEHAFAAWKQEHQAALAEADATKSKTGTVAATYRREAAPRGHLATDGFVSRVELPTLTALDTFSTAALDAAMQHKEHRDVPSRRIDLLLEVVASATGEVVWTCQSAALVRQTASEADLLKDLVRRLTAHR